MSRRSKTLKSLLLALAIGISSGCFASSSARPAPGAEADDMVLATDPATGVTLPPHYRSDVALEPGYGEAIPVPGDPARTYAVHPPLTSADVDTARLVEAAVPSATYNPAFARAARMFGEMNRRYKGKFDWDGMLGFLVDWSGGLGMSGYYYLVQGNDDGTGVRRWLADHFKGDQSRTQIGLSRHDDGRTTTWYIVFGGGNRALQADFPRAAPAGETAAFRFTVNPDLRNYHAIVLPEEGKARNLPVRMAGGTGELDVTFGPEAGAQKIEILATGQYGHQIAHLFTTHVGEPPRAYRPRLHVDESWVRTDEDAENLIFALINHERIKRDLPPLHFDPDLREIARGHTRDMREHHFFGHESPLTGGPGARFGKAGYNATALYENIGAAGSVESTHLGLMGSPGHREAILSTAVTHVGIGATVTRDDKGRINGVVATENFATPAGARQGAMPGARELPASGTTYLSDRPWLQASGGWGPVERDRSNGEQKPQDGRPLRIAGKPYGKGLGVHADSTVSYWLGGVCQRFVADVGLDDEVGTHGQVVFQVWADGDKLWDSGTMTGGQEPRHVEVPLQGRQRLQLVVTNGGDGHGYDHADWADARIVR